METGRILLHLLLIAILPLVIPLKVSDEVHQDFFKKRWTIQNSKSVILAWISNI